MKKILATVGILAIAFSAYAATTYTTNYAFSKPDDGDTGWGSAIRGNWDSADNLFKTFSDSLALSVTLAQVDSAVTSGLAGYWDSSGVINFVRPEISDSLSGYSATVSALISDSLTTRTTPAEVGAQIADSLAAFSPETLDVDSLIGDVYVTGTLTGSTVIADSLVGVDSGAIADTAYVNSKISLTALADSVTFEVLAANGDIGDSTGQIPEADQVIFLTGNQTLGTGVKTFKNFPRLDGTGSALNPTLNAQFATKYYVDNAVLALDDVTYEALDANGDIGTGASQVPSGTQALAAVTATRLNLNGSIGWGASQVQFGATILSAISDSIAANQPSASGQVLPIRTVTVDDDVETDDYAILASASSDTVRLTLPTAASSTGRIFSIKKIDNSANPVILVTQGGNTIDSAAGDTLSTLHQVVQIISSGSQWYKQ